mgnify:CR=1 FL=1
MYQRIIYIFANSLNIFRKRLLTEDKSNAGTLEYLKNSLFISILYYTLILGSIVYIPSIIASVLTEAYTIGFYDTIAIMLIIFLSFNRNLSIKSRKIIYSVNMYILGVILFAFLGFKGPGLIVLYCVSIWILLYYSRKAALISVVLNGIISFFIMAAIPIQEFDFTFFKEFSFIPWLVVNINLIAFNLLIVLSISYLINHLNESLINTTYLQSLLNKERESLIRTKQKAEESDRLKTAFLANMSHEIRTPMNGILGLSSLLSDPDINFDERDEYVKLIQKSGKRMLNIINEIVEISKIEAGLTEVNRTRFNIFEQIDYIYKLLKAEALSKNLCFSYDVPPELINLEIITDKNKFDGIMINLVKNAVKYTDKGFIRFGFELKDDTLELFVEDSGIGISKERINDILKRFVQADIADVQAREGAGLGLAISKSYAEMLGGEIWVTSEFGKGSTFYLKLPTEILKN